MDKQKIKKLFRDAGLQRLTRDIDPLVKPSIRLNAQPTTDESLPIGVSKLGGMPDLPLDIPWPVWHNLSQSFIAQINLRDTHPYDANKLLPERGMLWFFYDARQETYGDEPANRGGWSVFFREESGELKRAQAPANLPAASQFKAASLSFACELTLSQIPALEISSFDWTDEEQERYDDLLEDFVPPEKRAFRHRLLGNPDLLQDDLRLQCQLISHGVTEDDDPREGELTPGAKEWQLLFQVDTDERIGMRWASTGMLYYSITASDLRARRFENTWLILQSE
ncbi:YwqG family protein [Ktedonospora formicarum]|uniref:DUF1963 domain-containing protein n=1 Tax=Ktedonospora formicarum TaxID=2778364 RepID=A0A8J3I3L0_9CHLR|nr:YwqG family protein [Ktedonospora formicarum]GHO49532.1 hypothetical protein KSX_76950 [Ktedonospora formicarum]